MLANFADAILSGAPLLAPGQEGIHSVELANAMLLSSLRNKMVTLPINSSEYSALLDELIAASPRRPGGNALATPPAGR